MFAGLSHRVSNWRGQQKDEAGVEVSDEKIAPATGEGETDVEKKDTSPTKGNNKLEMFAGVKSHMTGWLSGGIPGLARGVTPSNESESQPPAEPNTAQAAENAPATGEQVKDDDASSATEGADSDPASLEGTPTDDKKEQQQSFGAVSTQALAGAKSLSGFLCSAVNKAGKTVVEAGAKIKKTVEENKLIAEFNQGQQRFKPIKPNDKGEVVLPWVGVQDEDELRKECLHLSTDPRTFLRAASRGPEFPWDYEAALPVAQALLNLDPNLRTRRYELVPNKISEENFWRNYFYRVALLRDSFETNTMGKQTKDDADQTLTSHGSVDQSEAQATTGQQTSDTTVTASSNNTLAESPGHEFVSDSMRVSDTDLEEVREGMKKLGMQPPKEEDWERELEDELKDYEIVTSGEEKSGAAHGSVDATAMDKDDRAKRIAELLANEDDLEDLK